MRKVLCVRADLSFVFLKPESPNPPFTHTPGRYEQATNVNTEDHFLLVCLYLCTEGEIYLFQAFKKKKKKKKKSLIPSPDEMLLIPPQVTCFDNPPREIKPCLSTMIAIF